MMKDVFRTTRHHSLLLVAACVACGSSPPTIAEGPGDPEQLVHYDFAPATAGQ